MFMFRMMGQIGLAIVVLATFSTVASAGSITTLFASNNGGAPGGAVYFDLNVGPAPILVTGFDTGTNDVVVFDFFVYTTLGSAFGQEGIPGAWTQAAIGSGTGAGVDTPTPVTLNNPFGLAANTSYGVALVLGETAGHDYTNGTGANQFYSNGDLSLTFGSATNVPFTGGVFEPRVWNGTIYYDAGAGVPEPDPSAWFRSD